MLRAFRWAGVGLAGLAVIVMGVALGGFAASEVMIRRSFPKPAIAIKAATDAGAVARGRRVAVLNGCHDCHGADFAGKMFHDEMPVFKGYGPNLTRAASQQTDVELDRAIRHGVAADGRSLWIMPSEAFSELTDAEAADLLAYIRSFPVRGQAQPMTQIGPVGRLGILMGKFKSAPAALRRDADRYRPDLGQKHAAGRDAARLCTECHGKDLTGRPELGVPDLALAAAYAPADFRKLLRTGVPPTGRDLGLMTGVAKSRFHAMTDAEIEALHDYLQARANRGL
jgi:mono/diheme cytochrome c family protein